MRYLSAIFFCLGCAVFANASNMFADLRDLARIAKSPKERMVLYTEAINAWENGDSEKDLSAIYYERGLGHLADGDLTAALSDYSKAVELNQSNLPALEGRGALYFKQGELEKALADYSSAIALSSSDPGTYFNRGNAYARKGEFDRAIEDYKKVFSLRGEDPATHVAYGIACAAKAEYDDALEQYGKALSLDAVNYAAYDSRAYVYAQRGEYARALSDYDKAINLEPQKLSAYLNRGNLYVFTGEYDKADADYYKAAQLSDSDAVLPALLGRLNYMRGDLDKASLRFTEILLAKSQPESTAIAFRYQAMLLKEKGDTENLSKLVSQAESYFLPLIVRMPNSGAAYAELSLLYSEAGLKPADALVLALKAGDIKDDFTSYYAIGRAQLLNGEPKKAAKALKKAVKANPSSDWAFYWLAKVCAQDLNSKSDAQEYYAQVIKTNPKFRFPLPVKK